MINSKKPSIDERASGIVENAVIPSREYKNNFQKDHFVSATLSTFSAFNPFGIKSGQRKSHEIDYILPYQ